MGERLPIAFQCMTKVGDRIRGKMLEPTAIEVPIAASVSNAVVPAPSVHNPRARKLRSAVWQDFTKERRADGNCVAICNHCKKQLTATSRSGTTHLRNHLAICTTTSTRRASKRRKLVVRRIHHNKSSADGRSGEGHASGDDNDNEGTHFDQELSRRDLVHMIVQHGYRFSIVDDVGFQKFVKNLQPQFRMVSYDTVRADSMVIYEGEKLKLQDVLFKIPCRVSISVDMWQSNTQMEYMCLTCHYIDHANDEWKVRKKILNFVHMEAPFTVDQIANLIVEKLHSWGIDRKLGAVVLDNCSGGEIVARELHRVLQPRRLLLNGDLFQVRSCAHILNLTVQESWEQASDITDRVRKMITYVKFERFQKFQDISKLLHVDQKLLVVDSPDNWSSIYLMFESACYYHDVLVRLTEQEGHYDVFLAAADWADVKALTEILDVVYHAMEKFPVENPTANLYFNEMCEIHVLLRTWRNSPSPVVAKVAGQMLSKFEGYWDLTRPVMAFASILDPRYKMKSLEYFFRLIYADEQFTAKTMIDLIQNTFHNLYNDYKHQSSDSWKNPSVLCYSRNSSSCMGSMYSNGDDSKTFSRITLSDARRGLDQYIQETSSGQSLKSDLEMYLEEAVYRQKEGNQDNFDILGWWKSFAAKYPVLSQMARDILAIPVSIIPLDSEDRTLNEYLSTMDPSTVQGLVCAQDWLREDPEGILAVSGGQANDGAPHGDELILVPNQNR
ncbi:zinc finger BED domain-containing protein RICESLEEPER 1-like isoform X1 [Panicum hallii]|uniref:zinc finger BED domain-containing protein RICESLEEPER 1-like isoform X1 n=2 Tax=Panicum hallii TaxID=206008 RepID=UPI000DF4D289|nr:zinc finger BED domain-containing protein RICESLEEPER 1-like isoform X1 [Panicum hallii]